MLSGLATSVPGDAQDARTIHPLDAEGLADMMAGISGPPILIPQDELDAQRSLRPEAEASGRSVERK